MSAHKCMILDLSNELLLHMTSYCDGKSLLSLAQTCRTLRSLCDDVSVVQGAFFRRARDGQRATPREVLKKWIGNDRTVLERHLVALDCAGDLVSDALNGILFDTRRSLHVNEDKPTLTACRYLPHLLVSGCHPDLRYGATSLLRQITLKRLMYMSNEDVQTDPTVPGFDEDEWPDIEHHEWLRMSHDLHSRIAFVFAFQSLSNESRDKSRLETLAEEHRDAFAVQMADGLEDEFDEYHNRDAPAPLLQQALLCKAVGVLALSVRTSLSIRHGERPKMPLLNGIPWIHLGIEPPTPFWSDELGMNRSWASWLARHNAAASQCEALDLSGEWVGVYEMSRRRRGCDPMMTNIHFKVSRTTGYVEPGEDEPRGLLIRAENCVDWVGTFYLHGTINCKTGRFSMAKQYTAGFGWPWVGSMTPFGLVGQWGQRGHPMSGFFWLYKRSWCEPSTKRYERVPASDIQVPPYTDLNQGEGGGFGNLLRNQAAGIPNTKRRVPWGTRHS